MIHEVQVPPILVLGLRCNICTHQGLGLKCHPTPYLYKQPKGVERYTPPSSLAYFSHCDVSSFEFWLLLGSWFSPQHLRRPLWLKFTRRSLPTLPVGSLSTIQPKSRRCLPTLPAPWILSSSMNLFTEAHGSLACQPRMATEDQFFGRVRLPALRTRHGTSSKHEDILPSLICDAIPLQHKRSLVLRIPVALDHPKITSGQPTKVLLFGHPHHTLRIRHGQVSRSPSSSPATSIYSNQARFIHVTSSSKLILQMKLIQSSLRTQLIKRTLKTNMFDLTDSQKIHLFSQTCIHRWSPFHSPSKNNLFGPTKLKVLQKTEFGMEREASLKKCVYGISSLSPIVKISHRCPNTKWWPNNKSMATKDNKWRTIIQ
jgi:hypothetical protein